jgi:alanine racemase
MIAVEHQRPTWAEISLPALRYNYRTIRNHLGERVGLMAVVKANAYGHGAVACARALEQEGADWFGVALIEEGAELRGAGIQRPICCLSGFWQGQGETVIAHDLTPAVYRLDAAEELNARAREAGRTVNFHLKVDTGMGRLGVASADIPEFGRALKRFKHLRLDGLLTHFAEAETLESEFTERQIGQYCEALKALHDLGFAPTHQHLANSAGIHAHRSAWGNLARAGAVLYGLSRDVLAPVPEPFDLRPVLSLHTRVIFLKTVAAGTTLGYGRAFTTSRPSCIATLPIGYADGLRRAHSNNGQALIRGRLAPIVGRVSMDLTLVDVTEVPGAALGDEALLIGEQEEIQLAAEDLAAQTGTISYEVVCAISARIPRRYLV